MPERMVAGQTAPGVSELALAAAAVLEGLPDAVVAAARDGEIVFVNELAEELFGYRREQLIGRPVAMLWPERLREPYAANMACCFDRDRPRRFFTEARGLRADGSEFIGEMSWGLAYTSAGSLMLAIGRDVSERRAAEDRLRAIATLAERALACPDPTALADEAVQFLLVMLPVSAAQVRLARGGVLATAGHSDTAPRCVAVGDGHELLYAPQRELSDSEQSLVRTVASILATALARLYGEERVRHDALHDPLTGLGNRSLLYDRLGHALARGDRYGGHTAVLFIDLDHFKQINDTHGHATGDAVLIELAARLQRAVRPTDTISRFGGDEFICVCEQIDEPAVRALARRLQDAIRQPLRINGNQHQLCASIGIALGHNHPDELLASADMALYDAKAGGGAGIRGPNLKPGSGETHSGSRSPKRGEVTSVSAIVMQT